ncbi:MAG TPA: TMEM143 family protein [Candidatus Limnocylindrales bacterium]|nr:TMEM143 family protein [Candidatus Limnocylindrales bacterium]
MGEHNIPFRKADIIAMCADDLPPDERESFAGFTKMLASLLHHRFHERIEEIKNSFHGTQQSLPEPERLAAQHRLEEELAALAKAANFTEMDLSELDRAFSEHSLLKVRMVVDRKVVDKILFFRRGEVKQSKQVPIWFGLRKKTISFISYARVLVYAKFKDAGHFKETDIARLAFEPGSTIVKLFHNVPRDDLEMVFPNVQVRMRGIDKLLIGVPAVISGIIVIATKLLTTLGLVLVLLAFWLGLSHTSVTLDQKALISVGIGLFAFGTYIVRQITNFKNRKILFMKALSENLYYRNLDNDAGVFHHLLDAAEEAEVTEAVLAYHFLRTSPSPLTPSELDARVEAWFASRCETPVDFDVHDGLRKLREHSLVSEDGSGRLSAVTLAEAKRRMDNFWDNLFDYNNVPVPVQ